MSPPVLPSPLPPFQNFWVCMQMALPHSDSRAHPKDITFNLGNPSNWCVRRVRAACADHSSDELLMYYGLTWSDMV